VATRIRVLVVDDSAFMRAAVARTLSADPRLEVVGQARDGQDAVEQARALRPDVITMDFNMPRLNGAEAIRAIFAERPVPVIMLSAHTSAGAKETVEALAAGAVDFVTKPAGEVSVDLSGVKEQLLEKVVAAAGARPVAPLVAAPATDGRPSSAGRSERTTVNLRSRDFSSAIAAAEARMSSPDVRSPAAERAEPARGSRPSVTSMLEPAVIIAISTGGPSALERLLPRLAADFPAGVLVVQHMPAHFTEALAERLDQLSPLRVREARDGDRIGQGTVLIAPGDHHVVVERGGNLRLMSSPPVNGCRPSADVTFQSAAPIYGSRMIGVVMTGMGKDGALGLTAVRAAGGRVVAQDKDSCVIWGMPKAAIDAGVVHDVVALDLLPSLLRRLAQGLT
jgi:two-component system chemotaxis response regulator CheB